MVGGGVSLEVDVEVQGMEEMEEVVVMIVVEVAEE